MIIYFYCLVRSVIGPQKSKAHKMDISTQTELLKGKQKNLAESSRAFQVCLFFKQKQTKKKKKLWMI